MGVFLAEDIFLFYVFWEAVLIPMFFLIGMWGHEHRKHAAMKFFLYTFAGSVLMFVGILVAVFSHRDDQHQRPDHGLGRDMPAELVFWLLVVGMLVKIPVVPLHTWLPDAHVEAPDRGLDPAGRRAAEDGWLRSDADRDTARAGDVRRRRRVLFAILGIVGIVYGAAMALSQTDLKRLVAYSSVAHMGFVLLAIAAGTARRASGRDARHGEPRCRGRACCSCSSASCTSGPTRARSRASGAGQGHSCMGDGVHVRCSGESRPARSFWLPR